MKNKKKKNKWLLILGIILILIVLVGVVPYIINKLLYLPILTNNTTDSDWLSFWGSFLGGIIGGIGTLIGVLLTINHMNKEKKQENEKNLPFIVPLEKVFYSKKYNGDNYYSCSEHSELVKDINKSDFVYFDVVNLAREHAFNVSMVWIPPTLESILEVFERYNVDNKFKRYFKAQCNDKCEEREDVFQILKNTESNNIEKTYLFVGQAYLINYIVENIVSQQEIDNYVTYKDISIGILKIICNNIQGKEIVKEYNINMSFFCGISEEFKNSVCVKMRFNLI